jgi:MFS family permease
MSSAVARMKSSGSKFSRRPGSHSKPPHTKTDRSNTNRWLVLIIVAAAQLMVVLDATIVNVALPHAQAALHISDSNRQWVVTAYSLAFGGLLLLGGRIVDYTGRRRTFLIGLVGFAGASAVGGVAQSGDMLFAARACQGAFAALLAPSALSILSTTFKSGPDRVKAFAVYGGVSASGAAIGLLIGGV